jgi:DNA-binding beta-propeller fold protein YncE
MRSLSYLLLLGLLAGCSAGPATFLRRPERPIGWPAGEQVNRIEVLLVYRSQSDVKRRPNFWGRLRNLFVGAPSTRLVSPYGLTLTTDDELLIADPALGVVHALSLYHGGHRTLDGEGALDLVTPVGVTVDREGLIYVSDSTRGQVVVFDSEGTALRSIGSPEQFGRPTGLVYDWARDRLLIVDTTGGRILACSTDGQVLASRGTRGESAGDFNFPTNIAVGMGGEVYVVDSLNARVQILSPDLEPLSSFGMLGSGPGTFARPKGVALDSQGHIYIVDGLFDNVQIFDRGGQLLLTFGASGSGFGGLRLPTGIFIDKDDRVFVADAGNSRVQVFQYRRLSE